VTRPAGFSLAAWHPLHLLRPGDGYWPPAGGTVSGGYTLDKQEPDVLLLVRQGG
jgi:hypothetical protein